MLKKLFLTFKQKGKLLLGVSLILSFAGLLADSDKVEISNQTIIFEYFMMTLIIFLMLFISTLIVKKAYHTFRNK